MNVLARPSTLLALTTLGLFACRSPILAESHADRPGTPYARLTVVTAEDCPAAQKPVEVPESCAWSDSAARENVLEANVEVVVTAREGTAEEVRVLRSPGYELDESVVACAKRAKYAGTGDTCAMVFRLARHVTDVMPLAEPHQACLAPHSTIAFSAAQDCRSPR